MKNRTKLLCVFVSGIICASGVWLPFYFKQRASWLLDAELTVMAVLSSFAEEGKFIVQQIDKGDADAINSAREEALATISIFLDAGNQFREKHPSILSLQNQLEQSREFVEKSSSPAQQPTKADPEQR